MLCKCTVEMGHEGAGKSSDRTLYYTANDTVEAYCKALRAPGTKKGAAARISVEQIRPVGGSSHPPVTSYM